MLQNDLGDFVWAYSHPEVACLYKVYKGSFEDQILSTPGLLYVVVERPAGLGNFGRKGGLLLDEETGKDFE